MPKIAKCLKCLKPFGQEALDRLRYSARREPPFENLPSRASGSNDRVK